MCLYSEAINERTGLDLYKIQGPMSKKARQGKDRLLVLQCD